MEVLGQVTRWDDDKGFGFITPEQGGVPVFAHISAMRGERRPCVGDRVLFVPDAGEAGRPRAQHIRLAGELSLDKPSIRKRPARTSRAPGSSARVRAQSQPIAMAYWLLAFACLAVPIAGVWYVTAQSGWPWLLAWYPMVSLISYLQYGHDKRQAQRGGSRLAERSLHLVELAGGWPGALLAQQRLRHKTRKVSYQVTFWLIVLVHQAVWFDALWGRQLLWRWLQPLLT